MKVQRHVDADRGVVQIVLEFPLDIDPDRAADLAWEHTATQLQHAQRGQRRATGTVPAGLRP